MNSTAKRSMTGYRSKTKDEAFIALSKIHADCYEKTWLNGYPRRDKSPAKTKNCIFWSINVLF